MKRETLRGGIVGTGAFANVHAEAMRRLPTIELIAGCDTDQKRSLAFSKQWKCHSCKNIDELLKKESLDIVTIATPNITHAKLIEEIIGHPNTPRLVIVEKPLCTSRQELENMEKVLKNKKTIVVVDHSRRFNRGFQDIRNLIDSGSLGSEILSVHWRYHAGWLHTGVHAVDTLRLLLGELSCIKATKKGDDRFNNDPLLDVQLRSKSHPKALIRLEGVPETNYKVFEGEIFLSQGRIRTQFSDVFIDQARDGDEFAPLLLFSQHFTVESTEKSIENLYTLCMDTLLKGDSHLLNIAGFDIARGTMDILFTAQSQAGL